MEKADNIPSAYGFTEKAEGALIDDVDLNLTVSAILQISRGLDENSQKSKTFRNSAMYNKLPHFAEGKVVKGFGRGSKELGIPTANFPQDVVDKLPEEIGEGVYFGWARVDNKPVYKMVMSIGWNPYYKNKKKSMETHVINEFKEDFYGSELKVVMLGYIRPMRDFKSLDELIKAIQSDIKEAEEKLELPEYKEFRDNNFFRESSPQDS